LHILLFVNTDLSMGKKEQPSPTPISHQKLRDRLKRALLRFTASVQPAFYTDEATKNLSYRSDFLGFLRLGKYKDEIGRILKVCVGGPPVDGRYFTATLTEEKDQSFPNAIVTLKPGPANRSRAPRANRPEMRSQARPALI
jgi:hypothetical protein